MTNALRHPSARASTNDARQRLAMLLSGATAEKRAGFTAEGLARTHRLPLGEIVAMLEGDGE